PGSSRTLLTLRKSHVAFLSPRRKPGSTRPWIPACAGMTDPGGCQSNPATGTLGRLREQLFPGLGVLDEDRAHRATLRGLEDLLDRVAVRIDRFRLAVGIEPEDVRGERLAHRIPDAEVVVDPDAHLPGHRRPLLPADRQRFQRPEGDARLIFQPLVVEPEDGDALGQGLEHLLALELRQGRATAVMNSWAEGERVGRPTGVVVIV